MSTDDDIYIRDLNQIRDHQLAMLGEIDEIRLRSQGTLPDEIERIRKDAQKTLDDIDEIRERREHEVQAANETGKSGTANPD
jgi:hypothetical protein